MEPDFKDMTKKQLIAEAKTRGIRVMNQTKTELLELLNSPPPADPAEPEQQEEDERESNTLVEPPVEEPTPGEPQEDETEAAAKSEMAEDLPEEAPEEDAPEPADEQQPPAEPEVITAPKENIDQPEPMVMQPGPEVPTEPVFGEPVPAPAADPEAMHAEIDFANLAQHEIAAKLLIPAAPQEDANLEAYVSSQVELAIHQFLIREFPIMLAYRNEASSELVLARLHVSVQSRVCFEQSIEYNKGEA